MRIRLDRGRNLIRISLRTLHQLSSRRREHPPSNITEKRLLAINLGQSSSFALVAGIR